MKFNAHKLALAMSAFAEKNSKIKINDLDTFLITTFEGNTYQVIVNKGKRLLKFKIDNVEHASNLNLIIFNHKPEQPLINTVLIEKTETVVLYNISTVSKRFDEKSLTIVKENKMLNLFLKQFPTQPISNNNEYMFEIPIELPENIKIENANGNVYFYVDGERFGNAITKSFYDQTSNKLFTNLVNHNESILANIKGNIRAVELQKTRNEQIIESVYSEMKIFADELKNFKIGEMKPDTMPNIKWLQRAMVDFRHVMKNCS